MSDLQGNTQVRRPVALPDKATWRAYRKNLTRRMCDQCFEREGTVQKGDRLLCPTCAHKKPDRSTSR